MMYKALYRQWRPQCFDDLVGQEHISKTLQNALKKGRIAHAYLFTGPRGTGKTSTAKIMAKAVNCLTPQDGQPCNICENCQNINNGRSLDVIEIDAASNRGIDEIREIRERVHFVPSQGKYKVYIIDEVHMLTTEAFNALLKTLEEPPQHVIFILATTEPQKIPATILSRCQRFDFRKIAPKAMEERLEEILASMELKADKGVVSLIVKKAEGGLRDAISILDQCISFSEREISLSTAYEVLGQVRAETMLSLSQAFVDKDPARLLACLSDLFREGIEPGQIIKDLLELWRNMALLLVCGPNSQLVIAEETEKNTMLQQAGKLGLPRLSKNISLLAKTDAESRWRQNMRIVLEITLLTMIGEENDSTSPPKQESTKVKLETLHKRVEPASSGSRQEKQQSQATCQLAEIKEKWSLFMDQIKESKKMVHALLTECEPGRIKDNELVLVFKSGYTFHKEKIEEHENRKLIENLLEKVYELPLRMRCALEDEEGAGKEDDPVQKAVQLFGPGIVEVKD